MTDVTASAPTDTRGTEPSAIPPRLVAAAVVGNALEFYDFTTYAYFAVQIGHAFFPGRSAFESLMLSLATFGAGFFSRPVGAVVIGAIADRTGRKPAMLLSFTLMGLAILGLALTPTYAQIGLWAPLLALGFRLLQGFALGGEVGPTTAFLVEAAPPGRRGFYGGWQGASQGVATLFGGLVGLAVSSALGPHALNAWGWRIAFLIGAAILPFGLIIRRGLPETLHHPEHTVAGVPEGSGIGGHRRIIVLGLALVGSFTTATYVFQYMTTYAGTTLHMGPGAAFGVTVVSGSVGLVFTLWGGALSDRFGRRRLVLIPRTVFLLATWPAFYLMWRYRGAAVLFGAMALMGALSAMSSGPGLILLTESLRKEIRGLVLATVYAVALAVFGGTTQLIITALIHLTGDPLAPAWYMMAATVVGIIAASLMQETAPNVKAGAMLKSASPKASR
ncbi:MAG TPA: MFS transporter [Caulobacteraceae bacterium]|jgi:MFS family permease|nr:MFS transporter [Caulobacteraceae bacterium]